MRAARKRRPEAYCLAAQALADWHDNPHPAERAVLIHEAHQALDALRRHAQLSEREQICIALLLEGKTLQAIATDIALSRGSVNTNIMGAIAKMRRHI